MKFDPKKPHGTITGHPWARYEQGGILFDYEGKARIEGQLNVYEPELLENPVVLDEPVGRDFELESAKEFLKNILGSGPLTKTAIYKECENNNQKWEKVEAAFVELEGEKMKKGNWTLWKLKPE